MSQDTKLRSILATDCGSTTTKAILIELKDNEYRLVVRGEAPTTVEAPFEDVTRGVLNAIMEVEELCGRKILDGEKIITPQEGDEGVDIFLSTSSAGGGLQMTVAGVVMSMTAESAKRASLSAGAIVMDSIATNDGRKPHERIERIRQLRPDMILIAGGTDGGTVSKVVEIAEIVSAARPQARLGAQYELPVVYAGNKAARENIEAILGEQTALTIVDNLRPTLEQQVLAPARDAIHELFMEHVMAHAPGYKKLMAWTQVPIMPTPGAVGLIMQKIAKKNDISVVGVDIGGATTDIFSVVWEEDEDKVRQDVFNRTVSANLGMSYSISNVFAEAGLENVMRWVPFDSEERALRNRIRNKMIRPTTIPQSLTELIVEQAIAREALRLAFVQHKAFARRLQGVQQQRTIADAFDSGDALSLINMMELDILVGSGGVLSHAPRRCQAALMMIDAFLPEGVTRIAVDSIFMMPQLGVLSDVQAPEFAESASRAALEVFDKDCLIRLGTCVAPAGKQKPGAAVLDIDLQLPDGTHIKETLHDGELKCFPLEHGAPAKGKLSPKRGLDIGAGAGKSLEVELEGGVVGLVFDGRGRPIVIPENPAERVEKLRAWIRALDVYPEF
jgi:uncharacterized protein (TIGR01319 family)